MARFVGTREVLARYLGSQLLSGATGTTPLNAVNDTYPNATAPSGVSSIHDFSVTSNDTAAGTRAISIISQSGPAIAVAHNEVQPPFIRLTADGLAFGAQSVTYELTSTGNPGESDQATMTVTIVAGTLEIQNGGGVNYTAGAAATHDVVFGAGIALADNRKLAIAVAIDSSARSIDSAVFDPAGAALAMTGLTVRNQGGTQVRIFWLNVPGGTNLSNKMIRVTVGNGTTPLSAYVHWWSGVASGGSIANGAVATDAAGLSTVLSGLTNGSVVFSAIVQNDAAGAFAPLNGQAELYESNPAAGDHRLAVGHFLGAGAGDFTAAWGDDSGAHARVAITAVAWAPTSSGTVTLNAVDDPLGSITQGTDDHVFDILANDTYGINPIISATFATSGSASEITGTGTGSRFVVHSNTATVGAKIVTYQLIHDNDGQVDTADVTYTILAGGGGGSEYIRDPVIFGWSASDSVDEQTTDINQTIQDVSANAI